MKHRATPRFWACYRRLPVDIQRLADKCYTLLKRDSQHPSLHFKKVGPFWSARVGLHYRAVVVEQAGEFAWFWIGPHAEYNKLLGHR